MLRENTLAELRRHLNLADLQVVLKTEWSSTHADHRLKIRKSLLKEIEKLTPLSDEQRKILLDLNQPPVLPQLGFSISHNNKCGGFALSSQGSTLGLDVEITARVQENLVARVAASREEVTRAPSAASLWAAKEAALKCLLRSGRQPQVIAAIEIGDWQTIDGFEHCRLLTQDPSLNQNRGCVTDLEDMKLAVFTIYGL